jgi:hypothetical protein
MTFSSMEILVERRLVMRVPRTDGLASMKAARDVRIQRAERRRKARR